MHTHHQIDGRGGTRSSCGLINIGKSPEIWREHTNRRTGFPGQREIIFHFLFPNFKWFKILLSSGFPPPLPPPLYFTTAQLIFLFCPRVGFFFPLKTREVIEELGGWDRKRRAVAGGSPAGLGTIVEPGVWHRVFQEFLLINFGGASYCKDILQRRISTSQQPSEICRWILTSLNRSIEWGVPG